MTEQDKNARPSQVTMAGWVALIGSVLLVFTLFEAVGQLRTVQFREQVEEFLSTPPGSGLGLEIAQVQEIMRVLMLLSGAAAAAAIVLAVFVLQRNNGARIGFTVAAVLIMLTAPVAGGFLPVMIGFAAIMLWSRPARDWFAGRPVTQAGAFAMPRRDAAEGRRPDRRRALDNPAEGNIVSSQDHPPHGNGGNDGNQAGDAGREPGPEPTWPRMPEGDDRAGEGSGRPLPPPMQGYGTPDAHPPSQQPGQQPGQQYGQQYGQQPGQQYGQPGQPGQQSGQPGQPGQQYGRPPGQPPFGGQQYGPRPGGPTYPQGGYPPPYAQPGQQGYGQQAPPPGYPPQGPSYGYGQPYGYPPQGQQQPHAYPPYGVRDRRPADPDRRPTTVTVAVWLTWVLSSLAVLFFLMIGLVMVAARDEFLRQLEQDRNFRQFDIGTDQVIAALWVMGAVALFWGLAAMALAWLTYRRVGWARITLVVSAAMTVLVSLAAFPVGLLHTFGAGAVVALLFLGGANEWFARRSDDQGFPGAFQPYGAPPAQQHGAPGQPEQQAQQPYGGQQDVPGSDQGAPGSKKDEPPSNVW